MPDDVDDLLGYNKINDKKQVRITDKALDAMQCDPGDLVVFENLPVQDGIKARKEPIGGE